MANDVPFALCSPSPSKRGERTSNHPDSDGYPHRLTAPKRLSVPRAVVALRRNADRHELTRCRVQPSPQLKPCSRSSALAAAGPADVGIRALGGEVHPSPAGPRPRMPRAGLVERQLLRYRSKQVAHVLRRLRRRLEEEEPRLARVGLSVGRGHGALVGLFRHEVELVARQSDDDVLVRLALELLYPRLGLIQRRLRGDVLVGRFERRGDLRGTHGLCDVVDDDGAVGVAVVHGC